MIRGRNIVLGVTGGIAAYKALDLVSRLTKLGANVDVIMTGSAAEFVAPLSFMSLSHNMVSVDMFSEPKTWDIRHISLAKKADLFAIVPATADIIGKIAGGIADDMLSTTVMATKAPVVIAPAMNTAMYENPIVRRNIETLKGYGYVFVDPSSGRLACGDSGQGKLAGIDTIVDVIEQYCSARKDLKGHRLLVTAGPTVESIDPVRYITNRSSGRMGYAIARSGRNRGAKVTLISGPTNLEAPTNVKFIGVNSNSEMYEAASAEFGICDIAIMAAAPADFKPSHVSAQKIKKDDGDLQIVFERTRDILYELGRLKGDRILVGFAAESEKLVQNAKAKMQKKNLDLIVANDITLKGSGFKSESNKAVLIGRDGTEESLPLMGKSDLADTILDRVSGLL